MIITVKVRTRKPETKIVSQEGTTLNIDVKAPPEKGKANQEIIRFLKRHYRAPIELISGATSTKKVFRVDT